MHQGILAPDHIKHIARIWQLSKITLRCKHERAKVTVLNTMMSVFDSSANSAEFLATAARTVIDVVGLDVAAALTYTAREPEPWKIQAMQTGESAEIPQNWFPSRRVLERIQTIVEFSDF